MVKIGLFTHHLGPSERNFCFMRQFNELASNVNVDTRIFYRELCSPCIPLDCAIMPGSEIFGFHKGVLITTDIETTIIAAKAPMSSKIIFYVDDIEWMRQGKQNYLFNLQAYNSKYVTLISKSKQYAECINNYCGKLPPVVKSYNLDGILQNGYFRNNSAIYSR